MKRIALVLSLVALAGLLATPAAAQDPTFLENHYKVYEVPEVFTFDRNIILDDQWGHSEHPLALLDKFANPVDKNQEGIPNEFLHQTWWEIDDPQVGRSVKILNQFGNQTWFVKDARYLVLPAAKNVGGPPADNGQHYKCYEAQGPILDAPVNLVDQWTTMQGFLTIPRYFCNPVDKMVEGVHYPTVNDSLHLACYQLEPPEQVNIPFMAMDQFGDWQLTALFPEWVCVPSAKVEFISVESRTWGNVKKMFRD